MACFSSVTAVLSSRKEQSRLSPSLISAMVAVLILPSQSCRQLLLLFSRKTNCSLFFPILFVFLARSYLGFFSSFCCLYCLLNNSELSSGRYFCLCCYRLNGVSKVKVVTTWEKCTYFCCQDLKQQQCQTNTTFAGHTATHEPHACGSSMGAPATAGKLVGLLCSLSSFVWSDRSCARLVNRSESFLK